MKTLPSVTNFKIYTVIPYQNRLLKFDKAKSARAYFRHSFIDLLTGKKYKHDIEEWILSLEFPVYKTKNDKRIIHLFYELGFIFEKLEMESLSNELLAIDIEYTKVEQVKILHTDKKIKLKIKKNPDYKEYQKKFATGFKELTKGNCYQFNLTAESSYSFLDNYEPLDFISSLWKDIKSRGAYGSGTYVGCFEKMFLSNSPECLFHYEEKKIITRPIKGTLEIKNHNSHDIKKLWLKLKSDKKNAGELSMITDLLRNDLCRIELPRAFVSKKKELLIVPGLIHQYSEIQMKLGEKVTLKNILEKIFPGGSITGAPKKKAMSLLKKLENRPRGFYCGSTLLFSKNQISASINIRSSEIDFNLQTLTYQAGGGVTLLSKPRGEFNEMLAKRESYIKLLTL